MKSVCVVAVHTVRLCGGCTYSPSVWWLYIQSVCVVAVHTVRLYGGCTYSTSVWWLYIQSVCVVAVHTVSLCGGCALIGDCTKERRQNRYEVILTHRQLVKLQLCRCTARI